jgi:hypothetical protein
LAMFVNMIWSFSFICSHMAVFSFSTSSVNSWSPCCRLHEAHGFLERASAFECFLPALCSICRSYVSLHA